MRKMMVFLLVTGILLGVISVIEEVSERNVGGEYDPTCNGIEGIEGDIPPNPAPCGGGEGSGGGGVPG